MMLCFAGILILSVVAHTTTVLARPMPQYGPQGMGNYGGYPMPGPMMGNGGQMMGPYGMNGDQCGPMYNMPGGDEGSHYHNGRMRGIRYHAHAGVDEWPVPKNPYMNARWNRHMSRSEFYANGPGLGGPMMGPVGHNRIPMDDAPDKDNDSDDDSDTKSASSAGDGSSSSAGADGLRVGGVNRLSSLAGSNSISAGADSADTNTSINIAAMSDRIINVNAFDGASIKSTPSTSAERATASGSSSAGVNTSDKPPSASTSSSAARQTITRSLNAAKPTNSAADKNAQRPENANDAQIRLASGQSCAAKRAKSLTNGRGCAASNNAASPVSAEPSSSSSSHSCPSARSSVSKKQAARSTKTSAVAAAAATTSTCTHQAKMASSKSSQIRAPINTSVPNKKEPSMKNIRGL